MSEYPYREFRFNRITTLESIIVIDRSVLTEIDEHYLASDIDDYQMHQYLLKIVLRDPSKSSDVVISSFPRIEFLGERDIWAG